VQQRHDRAERRVQAGQAVAKADVGAHGRTVGVAIDVPARQESQQLSDKKEET
jgi:hypothetical protein